MKRLLLLALLAASPAMARDPRIATRLYDAGQIVTISGRPDIQSTIEFGQDEKIENIAVGDSATWQVTPNKRASIIFVKPMKAPARTNMTVVTDRRTYLFDLITTPARAPLYVLRFTYPAEPKQAVATVALNPAPAAPVLLAPADKSPEANPADLHFDWATAGAKQLLPVRTFDDGKSTWLAWSKDVAMPAILIREPGGTEGPVNYVVKGDYVVVDGVPPQLVLREGKLVATLTPAPRATPAEPAAPALPTSTRPASAQPASTQAATAQAQTASAAR